MSIMKKKTGKTNAEEFEKSATRLNPEKHVLILYVAGMTPKSTLAIDNVRKFCEKNLQGRYALKVIDLYQQPKLAKGAQIVATPTLIKKLPLPLRKLIGDMSDTQRILVGIDLKPGD
jgi:circadian clock protein KaiB